MKKKTEKNSQIIMAATEEFLNKGFDAASMHAIAEQAEVSKRTLYKYYPSKDDLYHALLDELLDQTEEVYDFKYAADESIKTQLEKIIQTKIELTLSDSFINISKIVLSELLKSRAPTKEQLERINQSEFLFVDWVRDSQKDGKVNPQLAAKEIANQFHAIFKSEVFWPVLLGIVSKENIDLDKVKKTTIKFFVNSFCLDKCS